VIPAFGHHSFTAEFDASKTVTISGIISRLQFMNPHTGIYLDVKNADGTTRWTVEFPSPNVLGQARIYKAQLAEGTLIRVEAYPAKDGSSRAHARALLLEDGLEMELRDRWDQMTLEMRANKANTTPVK
jgi:hypothetical protein